MKKCPSEREIVAFLEGRAGEGAAAIERHVDSCARCRQILSAAVAGGEIVSTESREDSVAGATGLELVREAAGRYILLQEHARGGQSRVSLVMDRYLGREVAFKQLIPRSGNDTARKSRFLREAGIASRLAHPAFVPVHEVGTRPDGSAYYTMQFVRGRTLAESLAGRKSYADRIKLLPHFVDLCQAVAYAHSQGVVHRDIKPQNVMIGEFGETVVLDWGLAKIRDEDRTEGQAGGPTTGPEMTTEGSALGTPAYMSPEQAAGKVEEIDELSDVWNLGAVLHAILTGRPPFTGKDAREVLKAVREGEREPLSRLCPQASPDLVAIADKALQHDRSRRYQSAKEVAEEVEAFLTGGRVKSYEYQTWELFRRFAARHRVPLLVSALALVALVVLGVFAYLGVVAERNRAQQAEREERLKTAELLWQSAGDALGREDMLEAYARLRESLEIRDSGAARGLWNRLVRHPLLWKKTLNNPVYSVALTPDGRTIAASGHGGLLVLMDASSQRIRALEGHRGGVSAVAVSPDGRWLASAGEDKAVRLWEISTGELVRVLSGHDHRIHSLAFGPEGRILISAGRDRTARIWDPASGKTIRVLARQTHSIMDLAVCPDGRTIVTGGGDHTVRLWDQSTGEQLRILKGHTLPVMDVACSPAGGRVASAGKDGTVRIWDAKTGRPEKILDGHTQGVYRVAFSPDGALLASGGQDRSVRIWDPISGKPLGIVGTHDDLVRALAFHPDGRAIVSGGIDRTVRLFNLFPEGERRVQRGHAGLVYDVVFHPGGDLLASSGRDGTVRIWDLSRGQERNRYLDQKETVYLVRFSPDGKRLASAGMDLKIRLRNLATGRVEKTLSGHKRTIRSIAFSPDGRLLASGGDEQAVRLWSAQSGAMTATLGDELVGILGLDFSRDGNLLAASVFYSEKSVCVWDLKSRKLVHKFPAGEELFYSVSFRPDGKAVAAVSENGKVMVWPVSPDAGIPPEGRRLGAVGMRCQDIGYSPDGRRLAITCSDGCVRIWDRDAPSGSQEPGVFVAHREEANRLDISKDGRLMATAGDDETVRVWTFAEGRLRPFWRASALLKSPSGDVEMYSHRGWRTVGGESESQPTEDSTGWRRAAQASVRAVSSPDGERLCILNDGGRVDLWHPPTDRLVAGETYKAPGALQATPEGCHVLEGRILNLLGPGGSRRIGEMKSGTTAALATRRRIIQGHKSGRVDVVPAQKSHGPELSLKQTPANQVTAIAEGPRGMIIAGFGNGEFGIWEPDTGSKIDSASLHGSVTHLLPDGDKLYVVTELGDSIVWDLGVFHADYCELMGQIWKKVPVIWEAGRPVVRPPPITHLCASKWSPAP